MTFDEALYKKAIDIVTQCKAVGELTGVVVRLGTFHLLMSFLGSIGYIMAGSGLEELWSTVYAGHSVPHMMSGHAFSRSVRANLLAQLAVGLKVLQKSHFNTHAMGAQIQAAHSSMLDCSERTRTAESSQLLEDLSAAM